MLESWESNPWIPFFLFLSSFRYVNQNLHAWKGRLLSGKRSEHMRDDTYPDHCTVRFLGEGIPKKESMKCECPYDLYKIPTHLSRFIETHTQCFLCMKTNVVLTNESYRTAGMSRTDFHSHRVHCLDCNSSFHFSESCYNGYNGWKKWIQRWHYVEFQVGRRVLRANQL